VLAQARHGSHQIGTVRMASSRRVGVVDHDLRSFDSPNLFVVSAAVLPTSGQASPTLTVIALAVRLARTLARASIVPVATSSRKRG
jgi:choline dehydrogenase-like flavoprotein